MDSRMFGRRVMMTAEEKGIKYSYIAKQLGMSRQLLYSKMMGDNMWKIDEASKVMKLLNMPAEIMYE